jgi:hypothetical protein
MNKRLATFSFIFRSVHDNTHTAMNKHKYRLKPHYDASVRGEPVVTRAKFFRLYIDELVSLSSRPV